MSDGLDPQYSNAVTAFLNTPYVLISTQAVKDITDRIWPSALYPRLASFIDRFIVTGVPILLGAAYGFVVRPEGTSRMVSVAWGAQAGAAASGIYRTYQVAVKGK